MFDYSYTAAYVAAKETAILSKEALSRIAADRSEALRLLSQTGYGGGAADSASALVDNEMSSLRAFIMNSLPEELYSLLILPYDAHNLKVLLKCSVNGADPAPYLYDNTVFDTEIAAACCRGGEFSLLSENLAKLLDPAYDNGLLSSPFGISTECDRAFYDEISKRAASAPDVAAEYVRAEADGRNFISFIRAKNTNLDKDSFKALLLPGGSVPAELFAAAYESGADDMKAYTFGYAAHDALCAAADKLKSSMSDVYDSLDNYAYSILEPYRYEPESFVPVFLYFRKKTAEARYVREAFSDGGAV